MPTDFNEENLQESKPENLLLLNVDCSILSKQRTDYMLDLFKKSPILYTQNYISNFYKLCNQFSKDLVPGEILCYDVIFMSD